MSASTAAPHVTLVLGAGGPTGRAFHAGVLAALADECGWQARAADVIVGTSAGAQVAALLRSGLDAHALLDTATHPAPRPRGRKHPLRWPASMTYLRTVARNPSQLRLGPLVAALMPVRESEWHLSDAFRRAVQHRWPHRPLWIPVVHVDSGARVVFGRDEAPSVDVPTAVRCSSAVPGLRSPVVVDDERYVDGGIASPTHADLALEVTPPPHRRHTVVVSSPLSRFLPLRALLALELKPVQRTGSDVLVFEPDRAVADAMGWNPMDESRAIAVANAAYDDTVARLRRQGVASTVRWLLAG